METLPLAKEDMLDHEYIPVGPLMPLRLCLFGILFCFLEARDAAGAQLLHAFSAAEQLPGDFADKAVAGGQIKGDARGKLSNPLIKLIFTHPREVAGPSKLLAINEHPQFFAEYFERPVSDVPLSLQVPLLTPSVGRGLVSADDPSHNFRCHKNWGGVAAVHYHCNEIRLSGNQDVKRDA
jgi:hypothetical protein